MYLQRSNSEPLTPVPTLMHLKTTRAMTNLRGDSSALRSYLVHAGRCTNLENAPTYVGPPTDGVRVLMAPCSDMRPVVRISTLRSYERRAPQRPLMPTHSRSRRVPIDKLLPHLPTIPPMHASSSLAPQKARDGAVPRTSTELRKYHTHARAKLPSSEFPRAGNPKAKFESGARQLR